MLHLVALVPAETVVSRDRTIRVLRLAEIAEALLAEIVQVLLGLEVLYLEVAQVLRGVQAHLLV